ncbi:MAG: tetratricopeptide repeat protein [Treponema sp.]|uniref:TPR domain-containing protein n=1 Tax=Treponema sp. TaxID=166 RepID=UPI0025EE0D12|nr:tetratricopeptide repeat protein [Treponema sp.]MBQ8678920.1 tetratricopeptide repeat protein [Treponema sp.]
MNPTSPLDSVYFINIPEDFSLSDKAFHLDTTIPLPVQKKDEDAPGTFDMKSLTEEQILAGLLTIMAYDPKNEHILYYRSILKHARPNLKKELGEAAILKAKNEDFDLAEEIFRALHGFDPEDMTIVLNMALFFDQRADSYRRSGLHDDADAYDEDAQNYYREALDAEPVLPDAFFNAGFFYLKKREYKKAKDVFETYLALTCDVKDEELGENGIYKKNRAQQVLNDISNRNMDDDHFKAAYDLINRGEEEKGLEEIRNFIEKNPSVWNAWFMLGWGMRKLGRFSEAKMAFEKALSLEGGETSDTYNELSICLLESGDIKGAKKLLEKALVKDNENTKIISNLGYIALKEGDPSMAAGYFQTVLEIDPGDKIAAMELAKLDI